jgi:anti-anti-sigma factor
MASQETEIEQNGATVTVRFPGPEASHADFQEVIAACCDKMRYDQATNFLFDLKQIDFLASACIGSLVELLREVEPMRGKIALGNCADNVSFLFKVTKLDDIFGVFDDIDDALASF